MIRKGEREREKRENVQWFPFCSFMFLSMLVVETQRIIAHRIEHSNDSVARSRRRRLSSQRNCLVRPLFFHWLPSPNRTSSGWMLSLMTTGEDIGTIWTGENREGGGGGEITQKNRLNSWAIIISFLIEWPLHQREERTLIRNSLKKNHRKNNDNNKEKVKSSRAWEA